MNTPPSFMNFLKSTSDRGPTVKVSGLIHTASQTIPQTPYPLSSDPFDTMSSGGQSWEVLIDERVALAKECQMSADCPETLEKLLLTPALDSVMPNGGNDDDDGGDSYDCKIEIRARHKDTVLAGRKAFDAFYEVVERLRTEKPNEDSWEGKIGAAAIMAKDVMLASLEKFALDSKGVIRLLEGEEVRVENASYFSYCVNGYVLFSRKVNEALELVYESRKGDQQRLCTALETAGRVVHEAEVAALKWVAGQVDFASAEASFQT